MSARHGNPPLRKGPVPHIEQGTEESATRAMTANTKSIHIQYFALLREERGAASETRQTSAGDPRELFDELRQCYPFSLSPERLAVAINDQFSGWDYKLKDQDKVVFIPPVAGG